MIYHLTPVCTLYVYATSSLVSDNTTASLNSSWEIPFTTFLITELPSQFRYIDLLPSRTLYKTPSLISFRNYHPISHASIPAGHTIISLKALRF